MNSSQMYDELIKQYGDFEEGTEVGDAIGLLVDAASVLAGIDEYSRACRILLEVRDLVHDDLEFRVHHEGGINSLSDKEKELYRTGC